MIIIVFTSSGYRYSCTRQAPNKGLVNLPGDRLAKLKSWVTLPGDQLRAYTGPTTVQARLNTSSSQRSNPPQPPTLSQLTGSGHAFPESRVSSAFCLPPSQTLLNEMLPSTLGSSSSSLAGETSTQATPVVQHNFFKLKNPSQDSSPFPPGYIMKKAMVIRKTGVMGLGELGDFSQAGRANLPEVCLFIFELLFVPTIHFSDQYRISPQSSSIFLLHRGSGQSCCNPFTSL